MTYTRNFTYLVAVVLFAVLARGAGGVSAVNGAGTGAEASVSAQRDDREAGRSGAMGIKVVARVGSATVYAENYDQVANVEFALSRFAEMGLELDEFEVRYFSDAEECASDTGRARAGYLAFGNGRYVVYNCGTVFTLLHEMAHVYDVQSLDEATRQAFLAERGLVSWTHDEWAHAGGEHLADVLAWGLQDGNVRPSRTTPNDDESLYKAFVVATGSDPLSHDGR